MNSPSQREIDTAHDLLSADRRRRVLSLLSETGDESVATLAEQIAAQERDEPIDAVPESARKRVHVSLVHAHLPRLADHDVVDYDRDAGTVAPGPGYEALLDVARATSESDDSRRRLDDGPSILHAD